VAIVKRPETAGRWRVAPAGCGQKEAALPAPPRESIQPAQEDLVLRGLHANGQIIREATLTRLLEANFRPYTDLARTGDPKRTVIRGPDLVIGARALTSLALVLHELTTDAVKYGALGIGQGLVQPRLNDMLTRTERG
jgi:two-component sensor histidine kinase